MSERRSPGLGRAIEIAVYAPIGLLALAVEAVGSRACAGRRTPPPTGPADTGDADGSAPDEVPAVAPAPTRSDATPPGPERDPAELPIDDYEHLAASQIIDRLSRLDDPGLDAIEAHERSHRHRRTVLGRIAQLRAER